MLLDFNIKVCREGNESLNGMNNDNGVRVVNFPHLKILQSKVQCSHIATLINILGWLLMGNSQSD
jgi:hypothetical protein